MNYIYLVQNVVCEIIPEETTVFPGVPAEERYSKNFLSKCIPLEDASGIFLGMVYDPETGKFAELPEKAPEIGVTIDTADLEATYKEGVNSYGE